MQTLVSDLCASRYDNLVDTNCGALSFTEGECYVCGFVFVDLHSPFLEPVFNAMQMVLRMEMCPIYVAGRTNRQRTSPATR